MQTVTTIGQALDSHTLQALVRSNRVLGKAAQDILKITASTVGEHLRLDVILMQDNRGTRRGTNLQRPQVYQPKIIFFFPREAQDKKVSKLLNAICELTRQQLDLKQA